MIYLSLSDIKIEKQEIQSESTITILYLYFTYIIIRYNVKYLIVIKLNRVIPELLEYSWYVIISLGIH